MKWIQDLFTKRALMVALIAGGGALTASSFAMTDGGSAGKGGCEAGHGQKNHAERGEQRAKHMAELKAKLQLTSVQEAAWNTFANASQREMHPMGVDKQTMRGEFEKLNTPQRMDKMLAMSDMRRAKMLERAQATKAFYAQLTPQQKSVFDAEAMPNHQRGQNGHRHQS